VKGRERTVIILLPLGFLFCVGVVIFCSVGLIAKGGARGLLIVLAIIGIPAVLVLLVIAYLMNHSAGF